MINRPTVLFMSDWADTGFGTVLKEVTYRLAEMDVMNIHVIGWHSTPNDTAHPRSKGVNLHNTQFWNPADQFGALSFNDYVKAIQPTIVITLGDPWMVEHVQNCPQRDSFFWISYMPIDRDVINKNWIRLMKKPDVLLLMSQFGVDVINATIPFRNPRLLLHGVDRMVFKPHYPDGTDENTPHTQLLSQKKAITLGAQFKDKFIVGYVGRNQVRKGIPRTMKAFKAFNCKTWIDRTPVSVKNKETGEIEKRFTAEEFCRGQQCFRCDVCPAFKQREETEHSIIYLHTTRGDGSNPHDRPGIGWRIDELADRLGLHGRVAMTPNLNVEHGVPRAALAQIMNCFDVHLFLSYSEGFGLPVAETIACGVPNIVTGYSSMIELAKNSGSFAVKVHDYETYVTWENELAYADIGEAADRVNDVFKDVDYAAKLRKEAASSKYVPHWDSVAMSFRNLIFEAINQKE